MPEVALERDAQQLRLPLAHQAVVDVDAGQLVADGPMDQRRSDSAVDAARQGADHVPLADSFADLGHRRLDQVRGGPVRTRTGNAHHEVAQHIAADRGVDDLGMELDAVQVAARVGQAGVRRGVGLRDRPEALRRADDRVAVAHPDRLLALDAGEQPIGIGQADGGRTVLPLRRRHDLAAELVGHELQAVADAEHRDAAGPQCGVGPRGIGVVHRRRPPGQDHGRHPSALELGHRRVVRQQLGVDVQLAHAASDELRELAAEVQDGDGVGSLGSLGLDALWRRRVERLFEIGLDLGIVGGEDAVARVGRLAVHRAPALDGAPFLVVGRPGLGVAQCRSVRR